ncbi:hypothetical protein BKA70DRAFT_1265688 [Coprinopsis sp. MPI-PUGE-AT-0042]|nr:hypothetical protein BKA70DRAFT_1265688 [Coprinopsis sp. MPI-PUGE-AT-0042]
MPYLMFWFIAKPCKYFAQGNCVLPAEACNFAHVIMTPAQPNELPAGQFYKAGTCCNGPYCPYDHSPEAESPCQPRVQIVGQESHLLSSPVDNVYLDGPPMYGTYPPYVTGYHQEWSYPGANPPPHPSGYPSNYNSSPTQSFGLPAKGHTGTHGHPHLGARVPPPPAGYEFPPSPPRARHAHPTASHFTTRTHSNSTATTAGGSTSDDTASTTDSEIVAVTEDPRFMEHSHDYQSRIIIAEQPSPEHVSPFVVRGREGSGAYSAQNARPVRNPTPGSRATSRNSNKPRNKYKTKPCKFWALNRSCSQGDECTFRHDEPLPLPRSTSTTRQNARQMEAPKPLSPKENFFPISWRVIGGGVVVGTNKENTPVADSDSVPSVPDSPATPDNLPPPQLEIKTSNLQSPTRRKRSNSIPNTPSSSQLLVGNLFSAAESPGVL